jgi:predicted alpha/beta-hydrolase family hydrolase
MLFIFAPGAGAPSTSDWMRAWADRLAALGRVQTFDYRYRLEGRRAPDRLPTLAATHREALTEARAKYTGTGPIFLAGKSMGGRVGCHVALEETVAGLICFGYPLRSAQGVWRDEVLKALSTPILFLQGTRDSLCPLADLQKVRDAMRAPHRLHVVDGGDHSLLVRKSDLARRGQTQADVDRDILAAVGTFVHDFAPANIRDVSPG